MFSFLDSATTFGWVLPYGGGFGSTRDVIVSNIIRATIMFVPAYFCLIIMHAISKKNSIIEKLVYYLPTITLTLAFIMLYFPNRPCVDLDYFYLGFGNNYFFVIIAAKN